MRPHPVSFLVALCAVLTLPVARGHEAAVEMTHAANALLATLSAEQRTQAVFEFSDAERKNWHYIPRERRGLTLKQMTPEQRLLAHSLLASGLSSRGYIQTAGIMSLDSVLAIAENNPGRRDPENYFFSIFGTPGPDATWGWRFEGHHVALNFTLAGDNAPAATPQFFGSNPAEVRTGPRTGFRVLGPEEELGRALVTSLNAQQRQKAVILAEAPREIINVPGRQDSKPEGIAWRDLNRTQREALLGIVREYVGRVRSDLAASDLRKLEADGHDKLFFAWAGPIEVGQPHYYRIQSGTFVLEFDNVQNGANHVHSVWRDFDGDFGEDMLAAHHRTAHTK